jgi:hypothetical protein
MNRSNFTLFLGKPGSGKSSLLLSFLKTPELFKRVYHTVLVFMPENSRDFIKDSFFDKHLPEDQIFDEVNPENLELVFSIANENAKEGFKTLVIFDDVQRYFKEKENEKILLHMINNRRHARLSIWSACQNYKSIPLRIRQGITGMFIFNVNKKEMEFLLEEVLEVDKRQFERINLFFGSMRSQNPHSFLFVDTGTQRIFNDWNELVLD